MTQYFPHAGMTPSFQDKPSIDLIYLQKPDTTILWMKFCLKTREINFCMKSFRLHVVYMLLFCEANTGFSAQSRISELFLISTSDLLQPLETCTCFEFGPET